MPERVQLSRKKGWQKPENTVVVARPTRWGNPFRVEGKLITCNGSGELWLLPTHEEAIAHAVKAFRWQLENHANVVGFSVDDVHGDLAGKNLACWCPLDQPCHADVLLELANRPPDG